MAFWFFPHRVFLNSANSPKGTNSLSRTHQITQIRMAFEDELCQQYSKLIRIWTMKPELYREIWRIPSSNLADLVMSLCQTKPENSIYVSFQSTKITNSLQIKSWLNSLTKVIMSYNGTTSPSCLILFFSLSLSQVAFRKSLQTSRCYEDGLF